MRAVMLREGTRESSHSWRAQLQVAAANALPFACVACLAVSGPPLRPNQSRTGLPLAVDSPSICRSISEHGQMTVPTPRT